MAFQFQPYDNSQATRSIGALMEGQGHAQAEAMRLRGQQRGQLIGSIGDIAAGTIGNIQQARAQAQAQAQQAQRQAAITGYLTSGEPVTLQGLVGHGVPPDQAFKMLKDVEGAKPKGPEAYTLNPGDTRYGPDNQLVASGPLAPKTPEGFTLNPGQTRYGSDGQPVANVPAPEPAAPKVTYGSPQTAMVNGQRTLIRPGSDGATYAMNGTKIDAAMIAPEPVKATGGGDNSPLETIIGPDGKPIRVRREDAIGKSPASGTQKAASGVEKKALAFFNRAQQADVDLEGLEDAYVSKLGLVGQTRLARAPNMLQSEEGQLYSQAQRAFTEARLRKDSGAAIPDHEFESDRQTYFVQPGDTQKTIDQKRRARGAMLASLGFESGQALGEFMGDKDEATAVVQRYRDRSAGKPRSAAKPPAPPAAKSNPFR